jgi:hypothetical protein
MRRGFLIWQCAAWTAVVLMAAVLYWQDGIMSAEPKVYKTYHAIRAVEVATEGRMRDQYVGQVKAFAQAFGFKLTFSQTSPYPNDIVAHMERNDVWTVGVMRSKLEAADPIYDFAFYSYANPAPAPPSLDAVVDGLKSFLGQIEGAVVTEKTPPS